MKLLDLHLDQFLNLKNLYGSSIPSSLIGKLEKHGLFG